MIKGIVPALSEAGKIKIGGLGKPLLKSAAKNKPKESLGPNDYYRLPVKFDHFVITKTRRTSAGDLEIDEAIMEALPKDRDGKCREIPIVLHSDKIDDVFPSAYALYAGRQLACRGDGEKAERYRFDQEKRQRLNIIDTVPCTCDFYEKENRCKAHGTLHCSLNLQGLAIAGAVYKWRTTGIISIQRMIGSLQQILYTVGTLRNIPLTLRLEPVDVMPDGKASTIYACHVELRASDLLSVQQRALEAATTRKQLSSGGQLPPPVVVPPAADTESPEEQEEVWAEFHAGHAREEAAEEPTPATSPAAGTTTDQVKKIATQQASREASSAPAPATDPAKDTKPKGESKTKAEREAEFRARNKKSEEPKTAAPTPAGEPDYGAPDGPPAKGGDQAF